jgi:hypothetical protein
MVGVMGFRRPQHAKVVVIGLLSGVLLSSCTTPSPSTPVDVSTMPTPGHTSPSPSIRTFVLERGQNRLNLKPRTAVPGDVSSAPELD